MKSGRGRKPGVGSWDGRKRAAKPDSSELLRARVAPGLQRQHQEGPAGLKRAEAPAGGPAIPRWVAPSASRRPDFRGQGGRGQASSLRARAVPLAPRGPHSRRHHRPDWARSAGLGTGVTSAAISGLMRFRHRSVGQASRRATVSQSVNAGVRVQQSGGYHSKPPTTGDLCLGGRSPIAPQARLAPGVHRALDPPPIKTRSRR